MSASPLPRRDVAVRVTTTPRARASQQRLGLGHVFLHPRQQARPRGTIAHVDAALALVRMSCSLRLSRCERRVRPRSHHRRGRGLECLCALPGGLDAEAGHCGRGPRTLPVKPSPGSYADQLLRRAIVYSDNVAANALEVPSGGPTSGGSLRVNSLMRGLGLTDSEMYGGYIPGTLARRLPIPLRADESPYYGVGKHTSAYDLAQLFAYIHLAAAGKGRLARQHSGFTTADARYLLVSARACRRPRQARPLPRWPCDLAAQGGLDHDRQARRGNRLLARRSVRRLRDDPRRRRWRRHRTCSPGAWRSERSPASEPCAARPEPR